MAVNFLAHIHRRSQTALREALRDAFRCIQALMHVRIDIPYTMLHECEISSGYKHATIDLCHVRHQNYECDSYVKHACTYLLLNSRERGCVSASSLQHCATLSDMPARGGWGHTSPRSSSSKAQVRKTVSAAVPQNQCNSGPRTVDVRCPAESKGGGQR